MIISPLAINVSNTQKVLSAFASAQLQGIDLNAVKSNTFSLFAVTAFLSGALAQLGRQSTLPKQLQNKYLLDIMCTKFQLPRHNAEGLVSAITRMMNKYYLLENINDEGHSAAEKWLTSDAAGCNELEDLLRNYQDFTMLDLNSAGLKENTHPTLQKIDASSSSTKGPHHPVFKYVLFSTFISLVISLAYYWYYFM